MYNIKFIKLFRLRYYGHIETMNKNRMPKQIVTVRMG
jgi:hypothetical protein